MQPIGKPRALEHPFLRPAFSWLPALPRFMTCPPRTGRRCRVTAGICFGIVLLFALGAPPAEADPAPVNAPGLFETGGSFTAWIADSVIVSIAIWLLTASAWTVGMTLGSATLLGLSAWSWLVPAIYYFLLSHFDESW